MAREEFKDKVILNLINNDAPIDKIFQTTGISIDELEKMKDKNDNQFFTSFVV